MKEAYEIRMPYMARAKAPAGKDAGAISQLLRSISRESVELDDLGHVELVHLLEQLRCEYYELLSSEPDEDSLLPYYQWQDDISRLRGKIFRVKERLAAA